MTEITGLKAGVYKFQLTAWDTEGLSSTSIHNVKVLSSEKKSNNFNNKKPVAVIVEKEEINKGTSEISLDGTKSYDPDGEIVKFQWSKIMGPGKYQHSSFNEPIVKLSNLSPGVYVFRLRVFDNYGASSIGETRIIVQNLNPQSLDSPDLVSAPEVSQKHSIKEQIKLFPNPAKDRIQVQYQDSASSKNVIINIFNAAGITVKTIQLPANGGFINNSISINELKPGVYYLELRSENRRVSTTFIKQ